MKKRKSTSKKPLIRVYRAIMCLLAAFLLINSAVINLQSLFEDYALKEQIFQIVFWSNDTNCSSKTTYSFKYGSIPERTPKAAY